ncbi:MAG: hypothetical protein KDC66_18285 [Phaeodactylibacter sp.]|nr:hypothetical protein [Phaeodactylibacter sp.]MCB9277191.1 hypothetical protein [Lewinellaceae bacterium]
MKKQMIISIILMSSMTTFAQSVWKGGTPGRPTDWMEARNWSNQRVPDWNDNVVIPHLWHNNYPEVTKAVPAIAHLEIEGGARLNITPSGQLAIDGGNTYNTGILIIGTIQNEGMLSINNTMDSAIDGRAEKISNTGNGKLYVDEKYDASNFAVAKN